jgi:hypothetical protein
MFSIPKEIADQYDHGFARKEIPVSRQGFHLAMVFPAKGTYTASGRKRAQTISSS